MKQRRYSEEEKLNLVSEFLRRRSEEGISIRQFAGEKDIHYYTFRDFYRDPKYNPEWEGRYEYSPQDNPAAGREAIKKRKDKTPNWRQITYSV